MNDEEFQKLLNAEPPVVIKASTAYKIINGGIIMALACVSAVLLMMQMPFILGLVFAILIFMVGVLFCFQTMNAAVVLNQQNFAIITFKKEDSYLWKDVTNFFIKTRASKAGRMAYLTFDYVPENRSCEISLINSDLEYDQFIKLLNHWRERAIAANK